MYVKFLRQQLAIGKIAHIAPYWAFWLFDETVFE